MNGSNSIEYGSTKQDPDPITIAALIVASVACASQIQSAFADSRDRVKRDTRDLNIQRVILQRWSRLARYQLQDLFEFSGLLEQVDFGRVDSAPDRPRLFMSPEQLKQLQDLSHTILTRAADLHSISLELVSAGVAGFGAGLAVFEQSGQMLDQLTRSVPGGQVRETCSLAIQTLKVLIDEIESAGRDSGL